MIWLLISLAAAEPQFQKIEKGEEAQFSGRLLNDEALASLLSECEFAGDKIEIQKDLECRLKVADHKQQYGLLEAKYNALDYRCTNLLEIREEEVETLRRQSKPQRAMWAFFGGFVVGTAASLTTYYTVRSI